MNKRGRPQAEKGKWANKRPWQVEPWGRRGIERNDSGLPGNRQWLASDRNTLLLCEPSQQTTTTVEINCQHHEVANRIDKKVAAAVAARYQLFQRSELRQR
jgi:hypothetical protein